MAELNELISQVITAKGTIPPSYYQVQMFLTESLAALEKAKASYPVLPKAR